MNSTNNDNNRNDFQPQQGKKIANYYYNFNDVVGRGNFSQVYRGIEQNTGKPVAIKVIKLSSFTSTVADQLLQNQVSILKELDHENVIRCLEVLKSENNCYIVTQYYDGGDLQKLIEKHKFLHEKNISRIIYQIYKGLVYLNQHQIVHRDLKPANVFLDSNGNVKIADFGFAIKSSQNFKDINIGSPIYMAPEGLIKRQYGPKTQVWAFGILIYQMLHGQTPLSRCKDEKQLKQKVLVYPTFKEGISPQLKNLMQFCLTVNPKQRVEMKELLNTVYIKKLINEFESKAIKDLTSTTHTTNSSISLPNPCPIFIQQVKSYQDGLALLQYCRLVHKTSQEAPSLVFSQWLLQMIWSLKNIKIAGGVKQQKDSLMQTINNYSIKYSQQHKNSGLAVNCFDVILECQKILQKCQSSFNASGSKLRQNHLTMLLRETEMIQKFGSSNKLKTYTKASQVVKYLDSLSQSKYANFYSTFNK